MSFKTDAFVLRHRVFRDADRIYDLFTPHEGIIHAVLKSAAKPISKQAGHLLPFAKVRVMIGRGKMDHMAGVSVLKDYSNLRKDLKHLSLVSSVVELMLNEYGGDQRVSEFFLLENILELLDNQEIDEAQKLILVRVFLWKYLSLAGWEPLLYTSDDMAKDQNNQITPKTAKRGIIYIGQRESQKISASDQLIDFIKFIIEAEWLDILNYPIDKELNKEWLRVSQKYYQLVYDKPSQSLKLFSYG